MRIAKSSHKFTEKLQQSLQIDTYCPQTGYQVIGVERKHFALPGRQLTWWYCPYCLSQHGAIIDDEPFG